MECRTASTTAPAIACAFAKLCVAFNEKILTMKKDLLIKAGLFYLSNMCSVYACQGKYSFFCFSKKKEDFTWCARKTKNNGFTGKSDKVNWRENVFQRRGQTPSDFPLVTLLRHYSLLCVKAVVRTVYNTDKLSVTPTSDKITWPL